MAHKRRRSPGFPVVQALGGLALLWGSLWIAGLGGSWVGVYLYDSRQAPPAPYSVEQIRSMERVSPAGAEVARQDLRIWEESVGTGRSVARIEGALTGTILMLGAWGTLVAAWLWNRERDRRLQRPLDVGRSYEI